MNKKIVVVIASDSMGEGEKDLGQKLMKAFLFSLAQSEILPESILFYHRGALLTAEASEVLEDLRALEAAGVEILTCGTCNAYYGLEDKLAVGGITNMYTILEKQMQASVIVRP